MLGVAYVLSGVRITARPDPPAAAKVRSAAPGEPELDPLQRHRQLHVTRVTTHAPQIMERFKIGLLSPDI